MQAKPNQAQTIFCKCGSMLAACIEPYCYTDKDWIKDMQKYIKRGCTVKTIFCSDVVMQHCKCKELEVPQQLSIF